MTSIPFYFFFAYISEKTVDSNIPMVSSQANVLKSSIIKPVQSSTA